MQSQRSHLQGDGQIKIWTRPSSDTSNARYQLLQHQHQRCNINYQEGWQVRLHAIWCCIYYGVLPWWLYEDEPHFAPMGYWSHLWMNIETAYRWMTWRENDEDIRFELDVNS